jgi:hypothetical protein
MTRLRENNPANNQPNQDWVKIKDIAPFKIEENKWMLWASWGFIFLLPILALVMVTVMLF